MLCAGSLPRVVFENLNGKFKIKHSITDSCVSVHIVLSDMTGMILYLLQL